MGENPNSFSKLSSAGKTRRNEMNSLYTQLSSLVPHQSSTEICVADLVEDATNYIKQLQRNLESLKKEKREMVTMMMGKSISPNFRSSFCNDSSSLKLPRIDLHFSGSSLDVVLITGRFNNRFMFTQTLQILLQEEADVVSASVSIVDQSVFHTLHSKIGLEYDAARICERLRKLVINDDN